ncbi:MAG: hypothetical protein WA133_08905, partial [Syntrophales bacterium]
MNEIHTAFIPRLLHAFVVHGCLFLVPYFSVSYIKQVFIDNKERFSSFCFITVKACRISRTVPMRKNSGTSDKGRVSHAFKLVTMLYIFIPFLLQPLAAKAIEIGNEGGHCRFMLGICAENNQIQGVSIFDLINSRVNSFFESGISLLKVLPLSLDFVIADSNQSTEKKSNKAERDYNIVSNGEEKITRDTHQYSDLETFLIILLPSIGFQIVWHAVNYLYAQRTLQRARLFALRWKSTLDEAATRRKKISNQCITSPSCPIPGAIKREYTMNQAEMNRFN